MPQVARNYGPGGSGQTRGRLPAVTPRPAADPTMPLSRRSFVANAAALAAASATPLDVAHAAAPLEHLRPSADDPLGVRADFPVTAERTYLNAAYITPVPRQVVTAGQDFIARKATRPISLGEMLAKTDEVRASSCAWRSTATGA